MKSAFNERAQLLAHHYANDVAGHINAKDNNRQLVFAGKRDRGHIHDAQIPSKHFPVGNLAEHSSVFDFGRVGVIDAVHLGCLQDDLGFDLHGAQGGGGVGGKIRVAGAACEDHHSSLFEVADRTAADERLGGLVHLGGA